MSLNFWRKFHGTRTAVIRKSRFLDTTAVLTYWRRFTSVGNGSAIVFNRMTIFAKSNPVLNIVSNIKISCPRFNVMGSQMVSSATIPTCIVISQQYRLAPSSIFVTGAGVIWFSALCCLIATLFTTILRDMAAPLFERNATVLAYQNGCISMLGRAFGGASNYTFSKNGNECVATDNAIASAARFANELFRMIDLKQFTTVFTDALECVFHGITSLSIVPQKHLQRMADMGLQPQLAEQP